MMPLEKLQEIPARADEVLGVDYLKVCGKTCPHGFDGHCEKPRGHEGPHLHFTRHEWEVVE